MKKLNKIKSQSTAIPENQGNCRRAFLRFTTTLHCTKCFAKEATKQNFLFVESLHVGDNEKSRMNNWRMTTNNSFVVKCTHSILFSSWNPRKCDNCFRRCLGEQ